MFSKTTVLVAILVALIMLLTSNADAANAHHTAKHRAKIENRQVKKCKKARVTNHRHCRALVRATRRAGVRAWWAWSKDLHTLYHRESGWRHTALNPSSGACGIPQALPCSKMRSAGNDYRTSASTQLVWGIRYIQRRYRTPRGAMGFWHSHHWY